MVNEKTKFGCADILLPDFSKIDGRLFATIACDQFTSEPDYWNAVEKEVRGAPSTLSMILPELYLDEKETRIPQINRAMKQALDGLLISHPDSMIAVERTQSDGSIRLGIVGVIDLEAYDYRKGTDALIRATEGTVLERIPPRVAIRRDAPLELPHIMLLIDDPKKSVIEPLFRSERKPIYDFDLLLGGGHIKGSLLEKSERHKLQEALAALISKEAMQEKYGDANLSPMLFAVGDGNHSLASAKAIYEEVKKTLGDAAKEHPSRYALCEVVNLHEDSLRFEPIYRVVFHCDPKDLLDSLNAYCEALNGTAKEQKILAVTKEGETSLTVRHPTLQLTVGTLQAFLDSYRESHPEITVDYIHDEDSLKKLSRTDNTVGFLFSGMQKNQLFKTVLFDGSLPRKTFSMGHARDKRYYLECRRIK